MECSWAPLGFPLYILAKLLCFLVFVCLMQSLRLHPMDEHMFNDFLIGN